MRVWVKKEKERACKMERDKNQDGSVRYRKTGIFRGKLKLGGF